MDEVKGTRETPEADKNPIEVISIMNLTRILARNSIMTRKLVTGAYKNVEVLGGQATEKFLKLEATVKAGYNFIIKRISIEAPEKAKVKLYEEHALPDNLFWLGTQAKELAEPINEGGTICIEGPCQIIAIISEMPTEGGPVTIRLEGDLLHDDIMKEGDVDV